MRFGMSMKVSLPDKRTVSGWEGGGQKTGRGLWATSLVRPRLLWTSRLPAKAERRGEQRSACVWVTVSSRDV